MTTPWSDGRIVSPAEAIALIESQHPDLAPVRVESLGAGWDNTAYRVDGDWVFRFPRREIAAQLMEIELRVLPAIAPRLPLPIPVPKWRGRPTEHYPWPFAGYRLLPGRTACQTELSPAQREALAEPLARFLSALHGIPAAESGADDDDIQRTDTRRRVPRIREWLAAGHQAGLVDDPSRFDDLLAHSHGERPPRRVLVHADLYIRHILVDDDGRACGVIDWGDVHLGHPGLDFALAFSVLPPSARDAFRTTYGEIDEESWHLGRQRALLYGAALIAYGHDTGDPALVREGQFALRHLLE